MQKDGKSASVPITPAVAAVLVVYSETTSPPSECLPYKLLQQPLLRKGKVFRTGGVWTISRSYLLSIQPAHIRQQTCE